MRYEVTCPHCSKVLSISEEDFNRVCVCPHCHEEIDFTKDDIALEETLREEENRLLLNENKKLLNMHSRKKSRFKFIIAKFDEVEGLLNLLYREEGWYVISQSTVFWSQTSGSIGGFGAGTREDRLALILRKDD